MRLSRASGIDGLAGMAACGNLCDVVTRRNAAPDESRGALISGCSISSSPPRDRSHGRCGQRLLRPVLWASKAELQSLLQEAGVSWLEDPTNADLSFSRNHIRHLSGMQPLLPEDQQVRTQQHVAEHVADADAAELRWAADAPSEACRTGASPGEVNISADLLRMAAICADASRMWSKAAGDLLTACVGPLPSADDRPSAAGCSLDLLPLSQAPVPVTIRVLSATMQVTRSCCMH